MRRGMRSRLVALVVLGIETAIATPSPAQNPEKFERVVPAKPQPGPPPAPADRQAMVRELMRKAQANERENGFCARVTWPRGSLDTIASRPAGELAVYKYSDGSCNAARLGASFRHARDGKPCRWITIYQCDKGGSCEVNVRPAMCEYSPGTWIAYHRQDL